MRFDTRKPGRPDTRVIATARDGRDITRGYIDALPWLPPSDPLLRDRYYNPLHDDYEEVLRDDQVAATFSQRRLAVVGKPTRVIPGGSMRRDKMAAQFIEEVLDHIRWDTVTEKMMYARFYGYAVAECLWATDGRKVMLDRLAVRNRRRFVFGTDFRLKLLTTQDMNGEDLPERKFWSLSTGAEHDDEPYGLGLAYSLYWPVFFKRNQTGFWLVAMEKFGMPTVIGKYPRSADDTEKQALLRATRSARQDSSIVVPDDAIIELLSAARSGTISFEEFYDRMQGVISKVVLGQTMTTDDGSSQSQANVHMDVREDLVEADGKLVCDSFNRTIVRWLTEWNFPGAALPRVERDMSKEPDLNKLAQRDERIVKMTGKRLDEKYIEDTYGVVLGEPVSKPEPDEDPDPDVTFSEEDMEVLEQALDATDAKDWQALADPLIRPILERATENPEGLLDNLAALYPELDAQAIEEQLARIIFAVEVWARIQVQQETAEDDAA